MRQPSLDGQRWLPVQTGSPFPISAIGGAESSIFFGVGAGGAHQLVRLGEW